MLRKLMVPVVAGLILVTFISFAFAQCKTTREIKDQKAGCCHCCCCN